MARRKLTDAKLERERKRIAAAEPTWQKQELIISDRIDFLDREIERMTLRREQLKKALKDMKETRNASL
jgi:predicted  nucleic acid-binding Zn-ribbon protein